MMTNSDTPMALAGIKVLDLSRILAGPYAAQMFAVEAPWIMQISQTWCVMTHGIPFKLIVNQVD